LIAIAAGVRTISAAIILKGTQLQPRLAE